MEKKGVFSILLFFYLASCDRGVFAEEAALLFLKRFVYQEKSAVFHENFQQGEELGTMLEEQQQVFQEYFVDLMGFVDIRVEIKRISIKEWLLTTN